MAGELRIKSGTKLRMALDVPIGEEPKFNLICTFVKSLDVASFLISIPMRDGQPMPLDDRKAPGCWAGRQRKLWWICAGIPGAGSPRTPWGMVPPNE